MIGSLFLLVAIVAGIIVLVRVLITVPPATLARSIETSDSICKRNEALVGQRKR